MPIESCQRCVGNRACDDQVVMECLPVPYFGDITNKLLKVVTIGLNPALDEYYEYDGEPKNRSQRLALLADFNTTAREKLRDADLTDAKARRDGYFRDPKRDWHTYFQRMESVIYRVNPEWSYFLGSAVHVDLVACGTKVRWSRLRKEVQATLIGNCREHFLTSLAMLPGGTVLLCDGPRAMQEIQNLGLGVETQPMQLINLRDNDRGDHGWIGNLIFKDKQFPIRGWSSYVSQLSVVWRMDLVSWLRETFQKPG